MSNNLFDALAHAASRSAPFAHMPDGNIFTYADMIELSGRYANLLRETGVTKGDRVAVQTEKHIECFWLYLACLRTGAVYLPLNTAYTASEIAYFAGDASPRLFVCESSRKSELEKTLSNIENCRIETLDAQGSGTVSALAENLPAEFETLDLAGDELAAILYTSGTTGRSKGAMITHDNLRSNAEALVDAWRFSAEDVLLHALPIYHTHGLFVATNTVMLSGASLRFLPKFELDTVLAEIPHSTTMMGVPTFYIRLLTRPEFDEKLVEHMRLFISGSAPLSAEIHREFTARTGKAILERYGMTETNMITSNPYDGERRPGAVGFPLPGISLRIAEPESGERLADGEIGVIEITGPNVFPGYWNMPEKTKAEFRDDGYFITGDLGFIDTDGYVHISGRGKDLVISGGLNVYPAEVENALDELPEVAESAVIGVPHPDFGEGVTAIVVPSGKAELSEEEIRSRLSQSLARFKVPQRIVAVDALPRNAMGKIQKNVLREQYHDLYASAE